jgi:hypothetical protein
MDEKRRIVDEGASIAEVTRRHDLNFSPGVGSSASSRPRRRNSRRSCP